ncbi:hypothetical protein pEaSNUABM46_00061 [Erwinia phage pEa_SNUABM_46]|nr:hypothetical protein pEaSNUABM45_00061 [Erwinia phage pEa_SNUABM_45]QYW04045.1 hypothetical protein pEaSNUABM46_00061 [Erwinia phage pEa_SNUABM_46]
MTHETQGIILLTWLLIGIFVSLAKTFRLLGESDRSYKNAPFWLFIFNMFFCLIVWPFPVVFCSAHQRLLNRFW